MEQLAVYMDNIYCIMNDSCLWKPPSSVLHEATRYAAERIHICSHENEVLHPYEVLLGSIASAYGARYILHNERQTTGA